MNSNTVYDQKKMSRMDMKELFTAGKKGKNVGGRARALVTAQKTKNDFINA